MEPAAIANLAPGIIAIYSGAQLGAAHLSCILEGELGLPRAFYRLAERGIAKRLRVDSFFFFDGAGLMNVAARFNKLFV